MVGAADRMLDLVVAQIGSELVVPSPADELTPAVGQDFLRERVVAARLFQQIDGISYRLAMKQIQGDNITRIIIQIADDKDFFVVRHDEIHHVGVPVCHSSLGERRSKNRIGAGERLVRDVVAVDDDGCACKTARTS